MPNARAQRRVLEAARPKLHPTSQPLASALAVGGPRPARTVVLVLAAAAGATALLTVLSGQFAGPGWLFGLTFWAFNPPRAVITTTNSVVVMGRSMVHGKPTDVRAVVGIDALLAPAIATSGSWRAHQLGDEVVWMTRKEAAKVIDAARRVIGALV